MVAAAIADVDGEFDRIDTLAGQFPDVAAMLAAARDDLLQFSAFPFEH